MNIIPGIYNEQLVIDKPLTLSGPDHWNWCGSLSCRRPNNPGEPTIHILAGDVIVENLTLQSGPGPGIRVGNATFTNLTGIIIRNNIIRDHDLAGVLTANNASMIVQDNTIVDNGERDRFPTCWRIFISPWPNRGSEKYYKK